MAAVLSALYSNCAQTNLPFVQMKLVGGVFCTSSSHFSGYHAFTIPLREWKFENSTTMVQAIPRRQPMN